jgi:hypothetical protein
MKIKLYHDSLLRYDGLTSPYIYPRYGLGELPQVRRSGPSSTKPCANTDPSLAVPLLCCVQALQGFRTSFRAVWC